MKLVDEIVYKKVAINLGKFSTEFLKFIYWTKAIPTGLPGLPHAREFFFYRDTENAEFVGDIYQISSRVLKSA